MLLRLLADDDLLLSELELGPLQPDASGLAPFTATLALTVPAGQRARKLSLVLASRQKGRPIQLHDRWRFALPRCFLQPCLEGMVRLHLGHAVQTLNIDTIHNPRASDDRSGTLALELWSLDQHYTGGVFHGKPLGSILLGSLGGQEHWSDLSQTWHLPLLQGSERANGQLTLMLREWTAAAYVTRDWRELDWPRHPASSTPSLNRSSTTALRSITGISDRLARAIVASRPYRSVADLLQVRGMSEHAYNRLRDRVTI